MSKIILNLNLAGFAATIPAMALVTAFRSSKSVSNYTIDGLFMVTLWLFIFGIVSSLSCIITRRPRAAMTSLILWLMGTFLITVATCVIVIPGKLGVDYFVLVPLVAVYAFLRSFFRDIKKKMGVTSLSELLVDQESRSD